MPSDRDRATRILNAGAAGDSEAAAELLPLVYDQLRALAARYLRSERPSISIQPTDLVHEAYVRLVERDGVDWKGKAHFLAVAAIQMRRILVDHARAMSAAKRGGRAQRITLADELAPTLKPAMDLLGLDEALTRLASRNSRRAQVAELRLFAGMLVKEIASFLGVSERTVKDDWRVARAWLLKEI
jgi:RNA polymerase sigma factor (TIGR02999 family)